jgi:hypothetical protein
MKNNKLLHSKHKIYFVSSYNYLNLPVFLPVMTRLEEMGLDTVLFNFRGNSQLPEAYPVGSLRPYRELPLQLEPRYSQGRGYKATLLMKMISNYRLIHRFIKTERPSAVVVGSDLGNIHIRFLMDACWQYRIPVFVLYNCDIPAGLADPKAREFCRLSPKAASSFGAGLRFLRAVFFEDHIPGRYHPTATICVMSEDVRGRLIQHGIQPERVVATGMPAGADTIEKSALLNRLQIPENGRVIAFFPGPFGEVFGEGHEMTINDQVLAMIEALPEVYLVVKLHPRETDKSETMFKQKFLRSERCRVIKSMTAEELIPHVDLCIGEFSRALIAAAISGKRFFSINPYNDTRSLLKGPQKEFLEIQSMENLPIMVGMALNDPAFGKKMDGLCAAAGARFSSQPGSDSTAIMACHIYENLRQSQP